MNKIVHIVFNNDNPLSASMVKERAEREVETLRDKSPNKDGFTPNYFHVHEVPMLKGE